MGKWFILSYLFGASNMRFQQDMINVSYHVSLFWPSNGPWKSYGNKKVFESLEID